MVASAAASAKFGLSDIVKTHRRSGRRKAPLDPKFALKVALLAAGAIFIGWLCVRAATLEALSRANPIIAAKLAPDDPRVAIGFANLEFRARQGVMSPTATKAAVDALQRAPLAPDPFFFAGLEKLVRGDHSAALPLVSEARRRNPRSRMARLIYLDQVLRAGRVRETTTEIAVISRLIPETSRVLVPELAKYARDPRTAPALIQALRPDPPLREGVLEHLASTGTDPAIVMRLAASAPAAPATRGTPVWQSRMLGSLIDKGEVGRARTLWSSLAGVEPSALREGVYDGAFRGAPGPAPFNWRFEQSSAGVAEPTKAPALQVEYYGRADAELASQLLQLGPGRHLLSLTASGDVPASGGSVAWTLTCLRSKTPIATLPIKGIASAPKRLTLAFTVPANCPAQWLRLNGTSAEFPAAHSVTLADLQIRKA